MRPGGTVVYSACTINADENEAVVDAVVGDGLATSTRRSATSGPRSAIRSRPELLQTLPHVHGTSGFFVARLRRALSGGPTPSSPIAYDRSVGWSDWIRDGVEVEPSLYAADFRRLGEQIDALLAAGCRVFHFDCGDGHFVPPVTIGPVVLRSIAPAIHAAGGVLDCHLMVDDPAHHFEEFAASGARLGHLPRRGRRRPAGGRRGGARARARGRDRVQPRDDAGAAAAAAREAAAPTSSSA